MARPTYTVEIGTGVAAGSFVIGTSVIGTGEIGGTDGPGLTWTALTGVQEVAISWGRQEELGEVEAGACVVLADNTDGRYSPENTGSPLYPHVRPNVRLRVVATHSAVDYPLFYGQVHRWAPVPGAADAVVRIECADLFRRMARQRFLDVASTPPPQYTGARIAWALDAMWWPGPMRDLDAGLSLLPAPSLLSTNPLRPETSVLQHLREVLTVEDGLLWIAGDGDATFRDRYARFTDTVSRTSQATFGGASGFPYASLGEYVLDEEHVVNEARVTRSGGVPQTVRDTDAIAEAGGTLDYALESAHFATDAEAASFAAWIVHRRKDAAPRLRGITLEGGTTTADDTRWVQMLSRTINDRITIIRDFPGAFGLSRDFWIEGGQHEITEGLNAHRTTWLVSAAADPDAYLIIGHADAGQIGTGAIGY